MPYQKNSYRVISYNTIDESKLQALKEKLQAGENSPIVENFDGEQLLADFHSKHIE